MMTAERVKFSLRKNDQVQVMAGKDTGKMGKILRVNQKTGRVTVEKVNVVKRHTRPTQKSPQGGIVEKELPIHYSNVLLVCSKCDRGVRHGHKLAGEGKNGKAKKVRVCKRCKTTLDAA